MWMFTFLSFGPVRPDLQSATRRIAPGQDTAISRQKQGSSRPCSPQLDSPESCLCAIPSTLKSRATRAPPLADHPKISNRTRTGAAKLMPSFLQRAPSGRGVSGPLSWPFWPLLSCRLPLSCRGTVRIVRCRTLGPNYSSTASRRRCARQSRVGSLWVCCRCVVRSERWLCGRSAPPRATLGHGPFPRNNRNCARLNIRAGRGQTAIVCGTHDGEASAAALFRLRCCFFPNA